MMQGGMGPSKLGGQESLEGVGLKQLQAGGRGGGWGAQGGQVLSSEAARGSPGEDA